MVETLRFVDIALNLYKRFVPIFVLESWNVILLVFTRHSVCKLYRTIFLHVTKAGFFFLFVFNPYVLFSLTVYLKLC